MHSLNSSKNLDQDNVRPAFQGLFFCMLEVNGQWFRWNSGPKSNENATYLKIKRYARTLSQKHQILQTGMAMNSMTFRQIRAFYAYSVDLIGVKFESFEAQPTVCKQIFFSYNIYPDLQAARLFQKMLKQDETLPENFAWAIQPPLITKFIFISLRWERGKRYTFASFFSFIITWFDAKKINRQNMPSDRWPLYLDANETSKLTRKNFRGTLLTNARPFTSPLTAGRPQRFFRRKIPSVLTFVYIFQVREKVTDLRLSWRAAAVLSSTRSTFMQTNAHLYL